MYRGGFRRWEEGGKVFCVMKVIPPPLEVIHPPFGSVAFFVKFFSLPNPKKFFFFYSLTKERESCRFGHLKFKPCPPGKAKF